MWKIKLIVRQLMCNHDYYPVNKTYGDERLHSLYKSAWRCCECGKLKRSFYVDKP